MHFYLWFFLLSINIFFRHISSLLKRTGLSLSLSVFVTFCLLSSRRRQQHPKRRRRATAEPRETLSLSPFSFSPRRAERVVVVVEFVATSKYGRRTKNDGQRSRERGGRRRWRDRARSREGNTTKASFFREIKRNARVCVFVVVRRAKEKESVCSFERNAV